MGHLATRARIVTLLALVGACGRKPAAPAPAPATPVVVAKPAAPSRTCGVESAIMRGDRVGALRLGMSPDSVKRLCAVVRDTIELPEGQPSRVLIIATGGDTLRANVVDNAVYSVVVESPRFRMADSLHAGMPLARLLNLPGLTGGRGEHGLYVWSDAPATCGVSFLVRFAGRDPFIRDPSSETLEPYANSARISQALVRGCDR